MLTVTFLFVIPLTIVALVGDWVVVNCVSQSVAEDAIVGILAE